MAADPGKLGRHPVRVWSEHRSKHAHHQIEVLIGKGQLFRVAFFKCDLQAFGFGPGTRLYQKVGGDIHAGNPCSFTRRGYGQVACTACNIQHLHPRRNIESLDKSLSRIGGVLRDLPEVARHPHGAHFLFTTH